MKVNYANSIFTQALCLLFMAITLAAHINSHGCGSEGGIVQDRVIIDNCMTCKEKKYWITMENWTPDGFVCGPCERTCCDCATRQGAKASMEAYSDQIDRAKEKGNIYTLFLGVYTLLK